MNTVQATRREWTGLAVIALACILYVMDLSVLHLAVSQISQQLRPSSSQLLWIIDIYGFMIAGSLITMGSLGDRIGRRKILMIGAACFGAASVLAAFAQSPVWLIGARAVLGVAGATLAPSTLSLIRTMFRDPQQRSTAVGIWIGAFSAGGVLGPVVGGAVLQFFWWGAVFLINVPIMVALLILGPRVLPEYKDPDAGRADLPSVISSLVAILALIFAVKIVAQDGLSLSAAVSAASGLVVGAWFVRRQGQLADPLISPALFAIPTFRMAIAVYAGGVFIAFGGYLFIPQYLQLVRGLSPLVAGLWLLPPAVAYLVITPALPHLRRQFNPAQIIGLGLLLSASGFVSLAIGRIQWFADVDRRWVDRLLPGNCADFRVGQRLDHWGGAGEQGRRCCWYL